MNNIRSILCNTKRIVIKIGTSTITHDTGKVNFSSIDKLARMISDLENQDKDVILVTSGAIGVGIDKLKLIERPKLIREKQAVASVGQCELMHIYSKFFSEYGHAVGQILLTRDVIEDDHRRQNVKNTFETLIGMGIVPIVNENDSVSVEEIKFGENDTLSAIVSKLVKADLLVILSDIDGFYDGDPRKNPEAKIVPVITEITADIEKCAGGAGTKRGTGGMVTKLHAARIANAAGINMVIASGKDPIIVADIIDGAEVGTLFVAKSKKEVKV
jgi:glutamate 5-kinase